MNETYQIWIQEDGLVPAVLLPLACYVTVKLTLNPVGLSTFPCEQSTFSNLMKLWTFFSLKWYHTIISLVKQCDNTVLFASYKQTLIGISWELSSLLINLSIILCNCKQCCILAVGSNEYYNWAMWCRSYCLPIFERKNIKVLWDLGCINIYSIQFYLNVGSHQRKLGLSRNKKQYFMRVWLHWNSF